MGLALSTCFSQVWLQPALLEEKLRKNNNLVDTYFGPNSLY